MIAIAFFFVATTVFAKQTLFKNAGLSQEIIVALDVTEKSASGTYGSHEYGEAAEPARRFTGRVIPPPAGEKGVYLEIHFAGAIPYQAPPGTTWPIWHLKMVNHRAHLFIPMTQKSYEGNTPTWVAAEVELEPQGEL
ncbi:MAG: hypothetical protein QOH88_3394 [Verrucomicrobiota bacterium]|jgi:hypothetical protein